MTTMEVLTLIQAAILCVTGVVVVWYTIETKRLRETATHQLELMHRSLTIQLQREKRAAEPFFNWGGGSSTPGNLVWNFTNEGGPVDNLTITMQSPTGAPTGVSAVITPNQWLGTSREGQVVFTGEVDKELRFTIGFRTRIESVQGFFYLIQPSSKPIFTGSGEV